VNIQVDGAAPAVQDCTCLLIGTLIAIVIARTIRMSTAAAANIPRASSCASKNKATNPIAGAIKNGGIVLAKRSFSDWNRSVQLLSGSARAAELAIPIASIWPAIRPAAKTEKIATAWSTVTEDMGSPSQADFNGPLMPLIACQ
jgi:hypothetical protein